MEYINYDKIFDQAGRWGKYQFLVAVLVIMTSMSLPICVLVLPMMQKIPSFSYTSEKSGIIKNQEEFCNDIYFSDSFDLISAGIVMEEGTIINWAYELKLVCNTRGIIAFVGTVYFLASIGANLSFSNFPDRYGRRKVFLFFNMISFISLAQLVYLKHLSQLVIAAFLNGLGSLNMAIGSVIISENIDSKYSGLIMGITNSMFPLGGIINTLIMYFIGDWRFFLYFILIFFFSANILGFFYLLECPKWLYANQQYKEFKTVMNQIAEINGNHITQESYNHGQHNSINISGKDQDFRKHVYGFYDLIKYRSIRYLAVGNLSLWIISGFSFFGLLLNLEGLTGNIFIDAIVTYSAEFIAEIYSGYASDMYGRKKTAFVSFSLAFIGTLLFSLVKFHSVEIIFLFAAAIGVASGFNILYIYSAELLPTNIKSFGVSTFSLFNRLAASMIPILLTYTRNITIPISFLSLGAVLVVMTLPESLNYKPGDEVEEIKNDVYENKVEGDKSYLYFHELFDQSY
jgi:OCT family organic cation transporter-like MFS transporter 4/5